MGAELMRRIGLPPGALPKLVDSAKWTARRAEARFEVGARDDYVYLMLGETTLKLTPERAEEIAVELRNFAIEVRNGGGSVA